MSIIHLYKVPNHMVICHGEHVLSRQKKYVLLQPLQKFTPDGSAMDALSAHGCSAKPFVRKRADPLR